MALTLSRPDASRRIASLVLLVAFVASVVSITAASAWSGYPFLVDGPAPVAQEVVPTYASSDIVPQSLRLSGDSRAVELRITSSLASGGSLEIVESTAAGASATTLFGALVEQDTIAGALGVWQRARTPDGRNVLHARIGPTLVLISAPLTFEELLRIADSLRKTSPAALML